MENYSIFPIGDEAITISIGNRIQEEDHFKIVAMKSWFDQHPFTGHLDSIVAYNSLTIIYDSYIVKRNLPKENAFEFVKQLISIAYEQPPNLIFNDSTLWRIPVCYEPQFALDVHQVSALKNLSPEEVIEIHAEKIYSIYMIGFLPGFPYMAEVDERIAVPRKEKPSAKIPAGSVGLAGIQTGIYPLDSPGGWQIIGRTPIPLFNKKEFPPVKLAAGDKVKFYPISSQEFYHISANVQ